MVQMMTDFFAQGVVPLIPMGGPVQVVDRTDTHTVPIERVPDLHRTFWQRLRYAFTGR
jgi:hypothetical protein